MLGVLCDQLAVAELPHAHRTVPTARHKVLQCGVQVHRHRGGAIAMSRGDAPHLHTCCIRAANRTILPARDDRVRIRERQALDFAAFREANRREAGIIRQIPGFYLPGDRARGENQCVLTGMMRVGEGDAGDSGSVRHGDGGVGQGGGEAAVDGTGGTANECFGPAGREGNRPHHAVHFNLVGEVPRHVPASEPQKGTVASTTQYRIVLQCH
mmetsp:Transcript_38869/g.67224  ORF Transcript_38869/g.67224 Transcript_38869/m.67224 type:complete len:212 (-) Transcript_38869:127-762(-)